MTDVCAVQFRNAVRAMEGMEQRKQYILSRVGRGGRERGGRVGKVSQNRKRKLRLKEGIDFIKQKGEGHKPFFEV